jgi:voltage-gated potassium channel
MVSYVAPRRLTRERLQLLRRLTDALDKPMTALAFVWLGLLIYDLIYGLGRSGTIASNIIWVTFVLHFTFEFVLAPNKWTYVKGNWITAVALVLPALRIFRLVQTLRVLGCDSPRLSDTSGAGDYAAVAGAFSASN